MIMLTITESDRETIRVRNENRIRMRCNLENIKYVKIMFKVNHIVFKECPKDVRKCPECPKGICQYNCCREKYSQLFM